MKTGSLIAVVLFIAVAMAHLLRLLTGTPVTIGGTPLPMWVSSVGVIVPAVIAWMLWRESR
ncbi:MAG: hypothetical protein HKP03_05420 [Xanthomonadales bacterium]|nr:hypothetical protein [Xanthomonadales bacterium]